MHESWMHTTTVTLPNESNILTAATELYGSNSVDHIDDTEVKFATVLVKLQTNQTESVVIENSVVETAINDAIVKKPIAEETVVMETAINTATENSVVETAIKDAIDKEPIAEETVVMETAVNTAIVMETNVKDTPDEEKVCSAPAIQQKCTRCDCYHTPAFKHATSLRINLVKNWDARQQETAVMETDVKYTPDEENALTNQQKCTRCDCYHTSAFKHSTSLRINLVRNCGARQQRCHDCRKKYVGVSVNSELSPLLHEPQTVSNKQVYHCPDCELRFCLPDKLKQHCVVHTFAIDGILQCLLCSKELSCYRSLRIHILGSHFGFKEYCCPSCPKRFCYSHALLKHLPRCRCQKPNTTFYYCPGCLRKFLTVWTLRNHLFRHDSHLEPRVCRFCLGLFQNSRTVEQKRLTREHLYHCQECKKTFVSASQLRKHIVWHADGSQYQCKLCCTAFVTRRALKKHAWTHYPPNEVNLSCSQCHETFPYVRLLQHHCHESGHSKNPLRCFYCLDDLKYSQNQKSAVIFSCKLCNRKFKLYSHLLSHEKNFHGMSADFQCEMCEDSFHRMTQLLTHRKSQHKVCGNYRCNVCGITSSSYHMMKTHSLCHRAAQPIFCGECSVVFVTESDLQAHIKGHENECPYRCDLCRRRFRSVRDFEENIFEHVRYELATLFRPVRSSMRRQAYRCWFCSALHTRFGKMTKHIFMHLERNHPLTLTEPECLEGQQIMEGIGSPPDVPVPEAETLRMFEILESWRKQIVQQPAPKQVIQQPAPGNAMIHVREVQESASTVQKRLGIPCRPEIPHRPEPCRPEISHRLEPRRPEPHGPKIPRRLEPRRPEPRVPEIPRRLEPRRPEPHGPEIPRRLEPHRPEPRGPEIPRRPQKNTSAAAVCSAAFDVSSIFSSSPIVLTLPAGMRIQSTPVESADVGNSDSSVAPIVIQPDCTSPENNDIGNCEPLN